MTNAFRWIDGLALARLDALFARRGLTLLLLVLVSLFVATGPSQAATKCDNSRRVNDKSLSTNDLYPYMIAAPVPTEPKNQAYAMAQFGSVVSASEGGWHSVNCFGCVGFIQWCPGTFEGAFGYSYLSNPGKFPDNQKQVNEALKYWRYHWNNGGKNYIGAIAGKEVCTEPTKKRASTCVTATQSSILYACGFGCLGSKAKINGFIKNGYQCDGAFSARDGSGFCVQNYLVRGAGYDVSFITNMTSDELNAVRRMDGKVVNDPQCGAGGGDELLLLPGNACGAPPKAMPVPKCTDVNLLAGITLATKAYQNATIAATQQAYRKMTVTDLHACIMKLQTYWNVIKGLLTASLDGIALLIVALLQGLLTQVCNMIVNAINSLLAAICIPVPSLNLSLSVPSLASESCDGVSLLNFMSINGAGSPFPSSLPLMKINGMSLGAELLRPKAR